MLAAGCASKVANEDSLGKNIICFGDSLTEGVGASAGGDYPAVLGKLLGKPVINSGRSGETSGNALARIETDVLERDPLLVIVEFGANDAFQRIPPEETFHNIEKIVSLIEGKGSMVALITVKMGLFSDAYTDELEAIAKKRQALWIPDIMQGILTNPRLKSDQIHPNDEGYRVMAEKIHRAIRRLVARRE